MFACQSCSAGLRPTPGKVPPRYCGTGCRKKASRARLNGVTRAQRASIGAAPEPVTTPPTTGAAPQRVTSLPGPYDASAIVILSPDEQAARMPFVQTEQLAAKYKTVAKEFIGRLVTACVTVGFPVELAERRYLQGDRAVVIPPEVYAAHAELVAQRGMR